MKHLRPAFLPLLLSALLVFPGSGAATATKDQELFNQGKIAIFDKDWEGARGIFQKVIQEYSQSPVVPQAYYFIARCYQFQGKEVDALRSYDRFLQLYPKEPFLPGEARNSIVEIAASLMESGDATYKDRLTAALGDPNKDVRYFAAIRCSRLKDPLITSMAVPVLREIVNKESERDLTDRARIALLRLNPKEPAPKVEEPERRKGEARSKSGQPGQKMFHLVVYKAGVKEPSIELNLPVSLAQMAIAAMDDSAKAELKKKGVDIDNVWESIGRLGPTTILTIRDGENLIKLWIE
jgi:hypothetical protein